MTTGRHVVVWEEWRVIRHVEAQIRKGTNGAGLLRRVTSGARGHAPASRVLYESTIAS